jgi:hypothetical protein
LLVELEPNASKSSNPSNPLEEVEGADVFEVLVLEGVDPKSANANDEDEEEMQR